MTALGAERLAITRPQAAALCGLTPAGFDAWVKKGVVPGPIPGTRRWSKSAIERALAGEEHPIKVNQEEAGILFGASARTGQRWPVDGPPLAVAMLLVEAEREGWTVEDLRRLRQAAENGK